MNRTATREPRPIVIFGHCHEDGLVRLKATLAKTGIMNFVAGRLGEGDRDGLARAALVIVSSTTTSPEERERIGHVARRHSVPMLLLA
jgi:hypothetical protein